MRRNVANPRADRRASRGPTDVARGAPAAGDRRIAVTSPRRCTASVPDNPARGEAQGRIGPRLNVRRGHGPQTGVKAQKSTPSHPRPIAFADLDFSNRRSVTPTKINRGGSRRHERHVGPDRQKCRAKERIPDATAFVARRIHLAVPSSRDASTRLREQTCEGNEPQERRRATERPEGRTCVARPGRAQLETGSGTPRERRRDGA
jgi:hypothetical protein